MAVTKKSSTAPVKKIKVDNSSAAKAERKEQKVKRKSKLSQIRQKARQDYKSLTPKEKQHLAERNIFTQAIRHGASESDAKAEVAKYRARIKMKQSGKHATAARKALHEGTRDVRNKLKADLSSAKDALKKAREHNKSIKDPKARSNANLKAKEAYQNTAKKIASARVKAVDAKKNKLKDIHEKMQTLKKVFKKPVAAKGVRLVSAEAKPAAAPAGKTPKAAKTPKHKESAAERKERKAAEKAPGYGPQISKNRLTRRNNEAAKKAAEAPAKPEKKSRKAKVAPAPAAAPAPEVKAKRKYTKKPKDGAAAPAAPAAKEAKAPKAAKVKVAGKRASKMGPNDGPQISKNRLTRRNNEAAKKAAEAPAKPAKAAKAPKAPKAPKASTKPAAAAPAAKAPKTPKASSKKAPKTAPAAAAPAPKASGGIRRR